MILPDWMLRRWGLYGGIEPFNDEHVNPASVDLCLGHEFVDLADGSSFEADVLELHPGKAVLASTVEYIKMPPSAAGVVYLKSSMARLGLDHALAGFVDPGFEGTLTLEMHAHRKVRLEAGQRVIQLVLYRLAALPDMQYRGRYQGQRGPTPARGDDDG